MRVPVERSVDDRGRVGAPARRFIRAGRVALGGAVVVAVAALVGWQLDVPSLTHLGAAGATMKAATSIAIVCLALGVLLASPRRHWAPVAFGSVAALIGATSLLHDLVDIDVPLHSVLGLLTPSMPARMSPFTAVDLILLGVAVATLDMRFRGRRPSPWIAVVAGSIALVVLAGHVYDAKSLYAVQGFSTKSRPAAISELLVAFGMLAVRPRRGLMRVLTGSSVASGAARGMLPIVIAVPLLLGWLRLRGQAIGWYGTEFGIAVLCVGCAISLASLVLWSSGGLMRAEEEHGRLRLEVEEQRRKREADRARRELERQLATRDRQLAAILDAVPAGVVVRTADGRSFYRNAAAHEILGEERDASVSVAGASIAETTQHYSLFVAGTREVYPYERLPMARALAGETSEVSDLEVERDGRRIAMQVHGTPVLDDDRKVEFGVAAFVDIQRLRQQAFQDPLTKLANRAAFEDAYTRLRSICARSDKPLSLVLVDLDKFKSINDVHGHAMGDEVLRGVSRCLVDSVRDADVVARWGGEEIALLLPVSDAQAAAQTARRLLEHVCALEFTADAGRFAVSFSAGVTEIAAHDDLAAAIGRADRALYAAKSAGRCRVELELASSRRVAAC